MARPSAATRCARSRFRSVTAACSSVAGAKSRRSSEMKPLKILIVDDSATMRRMVRRVVELSEVAIADIYEAANGREALDVIDTQAVDAMFTDINMPVMNGIELLKQLSTRDA